MSGAKSTHVGTSWNIGWPNLFYGVFKNGFAPDTNAAESTLVYGVLI